MIGTYAYTGTGQGLDADAAWDYIRDGYLLSPRTVLKGRSKLQHIKLPALSIDQDKLSVKLQETLVEGMGQIAGLRCPIMFSGGFDSMLMALLARRSGAKVTGVTVQFDDFNPLTVAGAVQFAGQVGIPHHIIHVKAVEFLSAVETLAGLTDEPMLDLDLAIVLAALKKYDARIAGKLFISGMGSDQWFGNEALEDKRGDLEVRLDWAIVNEKAHHQAAKAHGYEFVFPFLSAPMLALSAQVPASLKKDKKLLRALALTNKIPDRGMKSEQYQVPSIMRQTVIKTYGKRAWPSPVSTHCADSRESDQKLRQIILGLWLEKVKI